MENASELSLRTLHHEGKIAAAHNKPLIFVFTSLSVFFFLRILKSANLPDWVLAIGSLVLYLFLFHFICLLIQLVKSQQITRIRFFLNMQFAALLGFLSARFLVPQSWDSFILPANLFALVTFIASLILILPTIYQKVALLGLTAFHFFGLLCLTLPGFAQSYLSTYIRGMVYYKVQKFLNLNDHYGYYSNNPIDRTPFLWIKIIYDDDSSLWVFHPNLESGNILLFERERSLIIKIGISGLDFRFLNGYLDKDILEKMNQDSDIDNLEKIRIYFEENKDANASFIKKHESTDLILSSVIRHTFKNIKYNGNQGRVKFFRCYLVYHKVLTPLEMAEGKTHRDRSTYFPYYLGDFDPDGKLLNEKNALIGVLLPVLEENLESNENKKANSNQTKDMFLLHSGLDISQIN